MSKQSKEELLLVNEKLREKLQFEQSRNRKLEAEKNEAEAKLTRSEAQIEHLTQQFQSVHLLSERRLRSLNYWCGRARNSEQEVQELRRVINGEGESLDGIPVVQREE